MWLIDIFFSSIGNVALDNLLIKENALVSNLEAIGNPEVIFITSMDPVYDLQT